MPSPSPVPQPEQVAAFFQEHRTGLVTLVFTDLVDSTALLQKLGDQAGATFLQNRRQIVREVLGTFEGSEEIETAGDSFLLVFAKPSDAVRFALTVNIRFRDFTAQAGTPLQERIGIHLGEVVIAEGETEGKAKDLYGIQLTAAARVMSLAEGGQILLTRGVFDSARQVLKGEDISGIGALSWVSHGPYVLKGVDEPVEVCEVGEQEQRKFEPPKTSEKAQRQVRPEEEPVLGWRPAVGQEVPNTPWVLEVKLGEGGFGEVWRARHPKMKENRVFKFCFRADRVRTLKRELTLFRLLKEHVGEHPNIVRLYEVYLDEPPFYLEEEFVAGKDLKTWCEAQGGVDKVPLEARLEIVAQAADGLQAAHDSGIIHRDVKPGNILVSGDASGTRSLLVKLADFGIGQVVSPEVLAGVTRSGFTQTMLGSTASQPGTHLYMAPELLAGKPASTRSDIYSLGVVLHQLLAGDLRQPLTADWADATPDALLCEDLKHCLAGKPDERFNGVAQLAKRLRSWDQRKEEEISRRAERAERERLDKQAQQRRKLLLAGTAVVLVLVALAAALGYGLRRAQIEREKHRALAYASDIRLAQEAIHQNDIGRAQTLLNEHQPGPGQRDLRGWEWRYVWWKCRSDELATIGWHSNYVVSVAVSPDGKWVASGGYDGLLKIWGLDSEEARWQLETSYHLGGRQVSSVAFSPNGQWLAAATDNEGFALLETPELGSHVAKPIAHFKVTTASAQWRYGFSLAFSPDSRLLAIAGDIGTQVWSLDTLTPRLPVLSCRRYDQGEPAVAWLPDTNTHVLAGFSKSNGAFRVSLFDLISTTEALTLAVIPLQTKKNPATLAFSPDGTCLAVGCWDNTIRIHSAIDYRHQVARLDHHTAWVSSLAFSSNGQWLGSAGADHQTYVWRTDDWQQSAKLQGHRGEVWTLAFTPDSQRLITGSKDTSLRLWPVAGRTEPFEDTSLEGRFFLSGSCPFSVDASIVLTLRDEQTLGIRQCISNYPIASVADWVWPSPDGSLLLIVTSGGGLWLTDLKEGARSAPICLQEEGAPIWGVAFSPTASWLAVADVGALKLWDLRSHSTFEAKVISLGGFQHLRFSQDEQFLGAVTRTNITEQSVMVWVVASGNELKPFRLHQDVVSAIEFSPDGTLLATASHDNTCKVTDLWRRTTTTLPGRQWSLFSLCFLDERRLAAGTGEGNVILWDLETGRELLLLGERQSVFAPVGALRQDVRETSLLATIDDKLLRVWRAPTFAEIEAAERERAGLSIQASAE